MAISLPPFDDFASSLSGEDFADLLDSDFAIKGNLADPADQTRILAFIFSKNVGVSLGLLERYHSWLSQTLDRQS